jgi:hypothetical protein
MNTPTYPRYNTLIARALMLLLKGEQFTHKDFQKRTASYRLSSPIEQLRNRHGWPIETTEETALTSDKTGRIATYGRYSIEPEILAMLKDEMGERLTRFIEAVQQFEKRGNHAK